MALDRFMIAPFNTGLQTNLKPWIIMDDAFASLNNAYVFRGRVVKRFGSTYLDGTPASQSGQLTTRLRVQVGITAAGSYSGTVPLLVETFSIGQTFSVNSIIFTAYMDMAGSQQMHRTDGSLATATYDISNGNFDIQGTGAVNGTPVYFYPGLPVMGLTQYQFGTINNYPSFAFDEQFAYQYSNGWFRSGLNMQFHGDDLNFFWSCNWEDLITDNQILFITNFNIVNPNGTGNANDDPIWYYDGSVWTPLSYSPTLANVPITVTQTNSAPPASDPATIINFVQSARIIVAFKNRLLLLNTIENDSNVPSDPYLASTNSNYVNRCRYSHLGSPLEANAWLEPNFSYDPGSGVVNADGAGVIDATTDEQIISAEFIKDRLIVYFERSTWEIVYTGNEVFPFYWQKVNTELGSQSQFSTVPFDQQIFTIGNSGVHACNGANVVRIDEKIPDAVFEIQDSQEAPQRIWGIRDYFNEMVYWNFPPDNRGEFQLFPTKVLVYNYKNGAWAFNDDTITCFGYFQQQTGLTWAEALYPWYQANDTWASGLNQAQFRQIIAGNQEGFVFIIRPDSAITRNASVMQITDLIDHGEGVIDLVIINHNLVKGQYITVENAQGISAVQTIYQVIVVTDANTITISGDDISGTYLGGGTSALVSNITIQTKEFNPYVSQDRNTFLQRVDFQMLKTAAGQITVDYSPSYSNISLIDTGSSSGSGALIGNSILETFAYTPLEETQQRIWHPVYFQSDGEAIQLFFYFDINQITNKNIAWSAFELHAMTLYTKPTKHQLGY